MNPQPLSKESELSPSSETTAPGMDVSDSNALWGTVQTLFCSVRLLCGLVLCQTDTKTGNEGISDEKIVL